MFYSSVQIWLALKCCRLLLCLCERRTVCFPTIKDFSRTVFVSKAFTIGSFRYGLHSFKVLQLLQCILVLIFSCKFGLENISTSKLMVRLSAQCILRDNMFRFVTRRGKWHKLGPQYCHWYCLKYLIGQNIFIGVFSQSKLLHNKRKIHWSKASNVGSSFMKPAIGKPLHWQ